MKKGITIMFAIEDYKRLQYLAKKRGRTMAAQIRHLVNAEAAKLDKEERDGTS